MRICLNMCAGSQQETPVCCSDVAVLLLRKMFCPCRRANEGAARVRICRKASSTPVESSALVSMKARLLFSANASAVSVLTTRSLARSVY